MWAPSIPNDYHPLPPELQSPSSTWPNPYCHTTTAHRILPHHHRATSHVATPPQGHIPCCHTTTGPHPMLPHHHRATSHVATPPQGHIPCCHTTTGPHPMLPHHHRATSHVATPPQGHIPCCHTTTGPHPMLPHHQDPLPPHQCSLLTTGPHHHTNLHHSHHRTPITLTPMPITTPKCPSLNPPPPITLTPMPITAPGNMTLTDSHQCP
ncbi:hypothetical protein Pcinc_033069 [Petrolisthes cinctipes]|uniref:Uncharacterized protein n=1 Tax=Petrolisthes cinctipes TaxID=88211 RepID=A0AAE1ESV2_PETCI|nr:hypothetical protein Pcinc_033069 [Petrolisthes cinctipes]